jgi:membrane protease YdiL (CAAX protease family)
VSTSVEPLTPQKIGFWGRIPVVVRAVVVGILVGMIAANVWPILLLKLGMPRAAGLEVLFLGAYIWWARGGGPPQTWRPARADAFRVGKLSPQQWLWGLIAAVAFAATIHAAIVVLFRLVPFPAAAFHRGYDFSFIPTLPLRWIAVVVSAASAGICEEIGFRGYMQRPIEHRHGAVVAIAVSSVLFTLIHLSKGWALIGMVPIILGAGVLLGLLAYMSRTLIFCIIGHTLMDVGLFAYWWTQIAGTFSERTIFQTGFDGDFTIACAALVALLIVTVLALEKLRTIAPPVPDQESGAKR